jgi:hypothetical protein
MLNRPRSLAFAENVGPRGENALRERLPRFALRGRQLRNRDAAATLNFQGIDQSPLETAHRRAVAIGLRRCSTD